MMIYIKKENDLYHFKKDEMNYFIKAINKEEAIVLAKGIEEQEVIQEKLNKINEFRKKAKLEIDKIEWKVLRYRNQKELGVPTTNTEEEYLSILQDIQDIRDKYNKLENEL